LPTKNKSATPRALLICRSGGTLRTGIAMLLEDKVRKALPKLAAVYTKHTGRGPSTIAVRAVGNSTFFAQLAAGRAMVSLRVVDGVVAFMADTWPAGVKWPDVGIERPTKAEVARVRKLREAA